MRTVHGPQGSGGARMGDKKYLSSYDLLTQDEIQSCFREVPLLPSSLPASKEEKTLMARNYVRNRSHTAPFLPPPTWMIPSLSSTLLKAGILASWKREVIQLLEKVADFLMHLLGELTTKGRGADSQAHRNHPA